MSLVLMDRTFDHINLFLFVAAAVCILNHVSCKATEKEKTDTSTKLYSLVLCFPLLSSPKNSHTPPYQTRSLPSVSMEKSKHNYRMQLFKYCDIWSLAGTKSACNERLGYKDWEDRERISAACPHPSTKHTHTHTHTNTQHCINCVFGFTSCSAEKWPHMQELCSYSASAAVATSPPTVMTSKHGNQGIWAEALSA